MKAKKDSDSSFEKSLERLEAIVEKLESEELGLDASLALFEEGIGLSRVCREKLSEVERRVEVVLKQADGEYGAAPFMGEETEAAGNAADEAAGNAADEAAGEAEGSAAGERDEGD